MYWFVEVVCTIARVIFLTLLGDSFFPRREKPLGQAVLLGALFGAGAVALALFPRLDWLRAAFWVFGGAAFVSLYYETPPLRAGLLCLALTAVCAFSELAMRALPALSGLEKHALFTPGNPRIIFIIVCHLFDLLLVVLICLARNLASGRRRAGVALSTYPSLAIGIMFCCLIASELSGRAEIIALGLLYTCIVVILFTARLQEQQDAKRELELANHHYAMQKAYYEQLHAQQEQIRALWHDLSKYLHAVQAEQPDSPSLTQLQQMAQAIRPVVDVENRTVSIILNEYAQKAAEQDTALTLDIQLPPELPVTAADLYILLGNTLDNALMACAALPREKRGISVQMRMHNRMLFYAVSNPYLPDQPRQRDGGVHGYGLRNVRECVKRRQGSVHIARQDGLFTLTALLNCDEIPITPQN